MTSETKWMGSTRQPTPQEEVAVINREIRKYETRNYGDEKMNLLRDEIIQILKKARDQVSSGQPFLDPAKKV